MINFFEGVGKYLKQQVQGIRSGQETETLGQLTAAELQAWLVGQELKDPSLVWTATKWFVKVLSGSPAVLLAAWNVIDGSINITSNLEQVVIPDSGALDTNTLSATGNTNYQPAAGDVEMYGHFAQTTGVYTGVILIPRYATSGDAVAIDTMTLTDNTILDIVDFAALSSGDDTIFGTVALTQVDNLLFPQLNVNAIASGSVTIKRVQSPLVVT